MSDTPRDTPPPFDRPFDGEDTRQRVHGVILHARDPMTAAEIADRANCTEDAARDHLSFYTEQGIVTKHESEPARYKRNDEHIEQRRVDELADDHTIDELQIRVSELTDQIEQYRDEYNADSPADVDLTDADAADDIDDVYIELSNWATLIEERRLHERAQETILD